jgi:methionyl aminopeptidase
VPAAIPRPDYALTGVPSPARSGAVKSPEAIERMRHAGQAARRVMQRVAAEVAVGVTSDHLDAVCHQACIDEGGYPSPLNYNGYPKSLCTSVNEVICHGIPDSRPLEDGDIVNCDVTIFLDGVHGDHNETFLVGDVDEESRRLVEVTRECLMRGIDAARVGHQIRHIGAAIQSHAEAAGFGVIREFVGHGIGETFHMEPSVPHYDDSKATRLIEAGMTFTIEPMISMGNWRAQMWNDGWTATTRDLSRVAQFEHTLHIREDGIEILTLEAHEPQPFLPASRPAAVEN